MSGRFLDMGGYPGQFVAGRTLVHRCPAMLKVLVSIVLGGLALASRTYLAVGGLLAVNVALYGLAGLGFGPIRRDLRTVLLQYPFVLALYLLRYDAGFALYRSGIVSLQIALAFLPALLLQRTTRPTDLMHGLSRVISFRLSFILFTSLRFVPLLLREAKVVYMSQVLRGARIAPRQLLNPLYWGEAVHCLVMPLVVRMLKLASDTAVAVRARGLSEETRRPRAGSRSARP